ncbi:unnamed protein product [Cuscuta europaea]|uniref:Uncharacterized protein n=1 Tax=Cuscuta europaea TaxID=41803 RepID=A0A9P0YZJ1_CUSEU|nr:unnamed protein product [Cuscuta europaea]
MRLFGVTVNPRSTGELSNGVEVFVNSVYSDEQINEDENAEVQGMKTNSATGEVLETVRDIKRDEELTIYHNYVPVFGGGVNKGVGRTSQESKQTFVAIEGWKVTEANGMSLDTPSPTREGTIQGVRNVHAKALSWVWEPIDQGKARPREFLEEIRVKGAGFGGNYPKAVESAYDIKEYFYTKGYGVKNDYILVKENFEKDADNESAWFYNLGAIVSEVKSLESINTSAATTTLNSSTNSWSVAIGNKSGQVPYYRLGSSSGLEKTRLHLITEPNTEVSLFPSGAGYQCTAIFSLVSFPVCIWQCMIQMGYGV